jgi:hypothetical protein
MVSYIVLAQQLKAPGSALAHDALDTTSERVASVGLALALNTISSQDGCQLGSLIQEEGKRSAWSMIENRWKSPAKPKRGAPGQSLR